MKMKPQHQLSIAMAAMIGGPFLFYLQSSGFAGPLLTEDERTEPLMPAAELRYHHIGALSDEALDGNPQQAGRMAMLWLEAGDPVRAESWLRYGACQLKSPGLMLLYGDFLLQRDSPAGRTLAAFWYRQAAATLPDTPAGAQEAFAAAVKQRLAMVNGELARDVQQ